MGMFDWLAYGVSHGYYPSYVANIGDTPHWANDLATPFHTPVTALWSGTVVEQKTGLPWGTEVFIQPDNKNLPEYYYYHLDTLSTHAGQHISAGEMIGLSGGQNSGGSNPSTRDMSSGPHTHVGFFTQWKRVQLGQGVYGTRPSGPDISPYIQALSKGQSVPGGNINTSDSSNGSNPGSTPQVQSANLQGFAVKAGLFLAALVLLIFGTYLMFKPQADEMIHKGVDAGKKAAEVAVVA